MSCNRTLPSVSVGLLLLTAGLGCGTSSSPTPVVPTAVTSSPAPTQSIIVQGTVVNEAGAPVIGGLLTFLTPAGQPKTVTDSIGHYQIGIAGGQNFGARAEMDGYESTYRDDYFTAGPGVLNFRLFRTLRVTAGDSVHVGITSDGSVCGFDDEWLCRTVGVAIGGTGTLNVSVAGDDHSTLAAVTTNQRYYPLQMSVPVAAGQEVSVQVLLPWSGTGGGVTLSTSIH